MSVVETLSFESWQPVLDQSEQLKCIEALESGKILFLPGLAFAFEETEKTLLDIVPTSAKNISYDQSKNRLGGLKAGENQMRALKNLMNRYLTHSKRLLCALFPEYENALQTGLTSLRTVEAEGRQASSYKRDDTRLHVDAFPSRPTQGKRILRVFCNVNPGKKNRVWHAGEPFENVAKRFLPQVKKSCPCKSRFRKLLGLTKGFRTRYDNHMLQLHDLMKFNEDYQKNVVHHECLFPPGSTWIVYSDQVSHAALSGQHMLEQTFYLPVEAMHDPATSPLKVLERLTGKVLV